MKRPDKLTLSKLATGETVPTGRSRSKSKTCQWDTHTGPAKTGLVTKAALTAFVDLGLSEEEIARYFKISRQTVTTLFDLWEIGSPE